MYCSKFYGYLIFKFIILFILIFSCISSDKTSDTNKEKEFNTLLESGKKAFYDEEYKSSIEYLKRAVAIKPDNQEGHYFLGYSYERSSSKDGAFMLGTNFELTIKSSNHFKKVISISPEYKGEYVVLDPYSKLTAIWGSLAIAYLSKGKRDSAEWAFQMGKSEGGYYPSLIEFNKDIMATCDSNAVLFTNGDNDTYPMWYLQFIEKYRKDVTIVNVSLMNTPWYIKQIKNAYPFGINNLKISLEDDEIDTIKHRLFSEKTVQLSVPGDSLITGGYIEWLLKPTIEGRGIRIQDLIMLNILKNNEWQRPIYFSTTVSRTNMLGLDNYLRLDGLASRLTPYENQNISRIEVEKNLLEIYRYEHITDDHNKYIPGMVSLYNNYRSCMYGLAKSYLESGDRIKANEIIKTMNKRLPEEIIPTTNGKLKKLINELIEQL